MKKLNLLLILFIISGFSFAQSNSNDSIPKKEQQISTTKEEIPIDSLIETKLKALKQNPFQKSIALDNKSNVEEYRKGNQFGPFLLGGFIGSVLFAVATSEKGYYGAGPKVVVGTLVTAIIGLFIPKYRTKSVSK